jgi:hypothetical protein
MLRCSMTGCAVDMAGQIAGRNDRRRGEMVDISLPAQGRPRRSSQAGVISKWRRWTDRRRRYRQLVRELRGFSAAELMELGIDPFRREELAPSAARST